MMQETKRADKVHFIYRYYYPNISNFLPFSTRHSHFINFNAITTYPQNLAAPALPSYLCYGLELFSLGIV
ncbi:MAG: hypothetical protein BGO69_02225 [Bacteroidetes bacterium 46-16]|nr:MAG: hypothetical protein BGO69_02225 [Bacteroidetes bacterium 46-16]